MIVGLEAETNGKTYRWKTTNAKDRGDPGRASLDLEGVGKSEWCACEWVEPNLLGVKYLCARYTMLADASLRHFEASPTAVCEPSCVIL